MSGNDCNRNDDGKCAASRRVSVGHDVDVPRENTPQPTPKIIQHNHCFNGDHCSQIDGFGTPESLQWVPTLEEHSLPAKGSIGMQIKGAQMLPSMEKKGSGCVSSQACSLGSS